MCACDVCMCGEMFGEMCSCEQVNVLVYGACIVLVAYLPPILTHPSLYRPRPHSRFCFCFRLRQDGRRLYELARQGRIVHREKRSITIYDLHQVDRISLSPDTRISANVIEGGLTDADVEDDAALPLFNIHLTCSGGTYVRTLMQDIARACGARAHITVLERTKGGYSTVPHLPSTDLPVFLWRTGNGCVCVLHPLKRLPVSRRTHVAFQNQHRRVKLQKECEP